MTVHGARSHAAPQPDSEAVKTTVIEPGVMLVALNRPFARNALSRDLIAALHAAIDAAGNDPSLAVVILAGNGPAFSSGHDLKELNAHRTDADGGRAFFAETMAACSAMMQAITSCPKPVIAAVTGTATAAGCQLVATCDLAVAADTAHFATPGVNIGLFCSTPMVALSRNVSRKHAMEMLLLGEMVSAQDALRFGLVNRVAPQADVLPQAIMMARTIVAKSKAAVAIGKRAFYAQIDRALNDAYDHASETMTCNLMIADAEEGIAAFLGKRPPVWKDA